MPLTQWRFQVSCKDCGQVGYTQRTRAEALEVANLHAERSPECCDRVTVVDLMARHGAVNVWHPSGYALEQRP